jgi:hypothetical protein
MPPGQPDRPPSQRACDPDSRTVAAASGPDARLRRWPMPAKTEKQRKFMGAELQRKREGKKTRTDMSEKQLEEFASKDDKDKKKD